MPYKSAKQRALTKACGFCGDAFSVQCPSRLERAKYCSRACRQKGRYASGEWSMRHVRRPIGIVDKHRSRACAACGEQYVPRAASQKWCRRCAPDFNWSRRLVRYGMTRPAFDELLAKQGGHCAICDKPADHIDHCHVTGRIRGILCSGCNTKLVALENPAWREKAEGYLAVSQ